MFFLNFNRWLVLFSTGSIFQNKTLTIPGTRNYPNNYTTQLNHLGSYFKIRGLNSVHGKTLTLSEVHSLHPRVDLGRVLAGALFAAGLRGTVAAAAAATAVGRRGRDGRGGRRGGLRDGALGDGRRAGQPAGAAAGRPGGLHDGSGRRRPRARRRRRGRRQVLWRADAVRRGGRRSGHLVLALDDAAAGRGRHADDVVVERRRYGRYGAAAAAGRRKSADPDAAAAAVVLQVLQVDARGRRGRCGGLQPLVLLVLLVMLLVVDRMQLRVVDHGRRRLLHVLRRVLLRRVAAGGRAGVISSAATALAGLSVVVGGRRASGPGAGAATGLQRVYRRRHGTAALLLLGLALLVAVHELVRTHVHLNGSVRARRALCAGADARSSGRCGRFSRRRRRSATIYTTPAGAACVLAGTRFVGATSGLENSVRKPRHNVAGPRVLVTSTGRDKIQKPTHSTTGKKKM